MADALRAQFALGTVKFTSVLELLLICLNALDPEDAKDGGFGTIVVSAREDAGADFRLRMHPRNLNAEVGIDNLDRYSILITIPAAHWDGLLGEDAKCTLEIQVGLALEEVVFCTSLLRTEFHHTSAVFDRLLGRGPQQLGGGFRVTQQEASYQPYTVEVVVNPAGEPEWTTQIGEPLKQEGVTLAHPTMEVIMGVLRGF
jgi:hypothetical protein